MLSLCDHIWNVVIKWQELFYWYESNNFPCRDWRHFKCRHWMTWFEISSLGYHFQHMSLHTAVLRNGTHLSNTAPSFARPGEFQPSGIYYCVCCNGHCASLSTPVYSSTFFFFIRLTNDHHRGGRQQRRIVDAFDNLPNMEWLMKLTPQCFGNVGRQSITYLSMMWNIEHDCHRAFDCIFTIFQECMQE